MDFVDWTTHVFELLLQEQRRSARARSTGLMLEQIISLTRDAAPDGSASNASATGGDRVKAVWQALEGLTSVDLVTTRDGRQSRVSPWTTTPPGREGRDALLPIWQGICAQRLEPDTEELLRLVNRLSPREGQGFVWLEDLGHECLLAELQWAEGFQQLHAAASELGQLGLAAVRGAFGSSNVQATYQGLVWETRRAFTTEAVFLDELVAEWETTSVEFKQELHTDTAAEKAEFIKDLLGLVNTQASGRRWFIIGFNEKTHKYHGPPDPKLTQNHLEQLVGNYIRPHLTIKYDTVDYHDGHVGKLEVIREREKLPYRVATKLTYERRRKPHELAKGEWFVRHSSQTEPPTEDEKLAIEAEGERARARLLAD